jgi:hypothetical protein
MEMTVGERELIWFLSIAMVVLGRFASLFNGGVDLLGVSLRGMYLSWPGEARMSSRERLGEL